MILLIIYVLLIEVQIVRRIIINYFYNVMCDKRFDNLLFIGDCNLPGIDWHIWSSSIQITS